MNLHKKGQGLSLNAIIVALLALIVLVVLTVLFVTRTGQVDTKAQETANTELITMRITYGTCQPTASDESSFLAEIASAGSDANAKAAAKTKFEGRIQTCKAVADKTACESGACSWKG
ncbi:hypothetical protein HYT55_03395 [Candidatus Woesearchaeota archaeon]|nr:hypothetical protein [Candidatus Woesearchaeota archaeon]